MLVKTLSYQLWVCLSWSCPFNSSWLSLELSHSSYHGNRWLSVSAATAATWKLSEIDKQTCGGTEEGHIGVLLNCVAAAYDCDSPDTSITLIFSDCLIWKHWSAHVNMILQESQADYTAFSVEEYTHATQNIITVRNVSLINQVHKHQSLVIHEY